MENTAGSGSSAAVPSEPGPERVPLTVPAAAQALGISERAVRKRITTGTLEGIRDGSRWLVYLPEPSGPGSGLDRFRFAVPAGTSSDSRYSAVPGTALDPLLEDLRELRRRNEDLAGQVGFWQGRYQESLSTIKLLSAPVPDAVELQWLLSNDALLVAILAQRVVVIVSDISDKRATENSGVTGDERPANSPGGW